MKKSISIAVLVAVSGLAMTAGAQELNGLKAADVAARTEAAAPAIIPAPVPVAALQKTGAPANSAFDGKADVSKRAAADGAAGQAFMKEIFAVLASGPLPGGCSLDINSYTPSVFQPVTGDSLNVGIAKNGKHTDILMGGTASVSLEGAGKKYFYESIEAPGDGWISRREKNTFTLVTGAGGRTVSVSIELAREKTGPFGSGWNVTGAVVCR